MITRAPEVIKKCVSNRNVRNGDAERRKTMSKSSNTIPEDVVLTMDMLTDPNR